MGKDVRDRWVEVGGLRVHLLVAGEANAPPVLLLHGGGYDSASLSYGKSIGPVSRNNKVFAPDWPGYGRSGKPKIRHSTGYHVDFLGRLMDVLGLEQSSLVGISMGGAISLGFALRSPRRIEKLVLVDSHGLGREVPWRTAIVRGGPAAAPEQGGVGGPAPQPRDGGAELADRFLRSPARHEGPRGRGPPSGEGTGGGAGFEILAEKRDQAERPAHQLRRQAARFGGADADPPRGGRRVRACFVSAKGTLVDRKLGVARLPPARSLAHAR